MEQSKYSIHPLIVAAFVPFVYKDYLLNRGFTQWFHWMGLAQFLTGSNALARVQAISGISVCLGWYSALVYAWCHYGEFMKILYKNLPEVFPTTIFDADTDEIRFDSDEALGAMAVAHILDTLAHPVLTYYFWRRAGGSVSKIATWDAIFGFYAYSRTWSMVHSMMDSGKPSPFYFGHDVYIVDHLDCYLPSYIAEAVVVLFLIGYKLTVTPTAASEPKILDVSKAIADSQKYETRPGLAYSPSALSEETTSFSRMTSPVSSTSSLKDLASSAPDLSSRSRRLSPVGANDNGTSAGTDWSGM